MQHLSDCVLMAALLSQVMCLQVMDITMKLITPTMVPELQAPEHECQPVWSAKQQHHRQPYVAHVASVVQRGAPTACEPADAPTPKYARSTPALPGYYLTISFSMNQAILPR